MKKYTAFLLIITFLIIFLFIILDILDITNYIRLTNNYDWLNFFGSFLGSVIGGTVTFTGIYLTLQFQKKSDDEKNRLALIPIIEYKISYNKADFDNSKGQLAGESWSHINIENAKYDDENREEWYFNLIMSNSGLGHGQIVSIKMIFGDNNEKFIQEVEEGYSYYLLKKDSIKSFKFMIYAPSERFKNNHISGKEFSYSMKLIVKYQDLLSNSYEQEIIASLSKSVLKDKDKIINSSTFASLHFYKNFKYLK